MDKLTWFKFTPTDWIMGKIQRCPEITQIRFLRLACLYWNKECILSFEDAEIEIDKEHLDILILKKVIKVSGGFISIDFLNEQMEDITETSEKRRLAVNKRWKKQKHKSTDEIQNDTSVLQNDTDKSKSREELEKKREEEIREEFLLKKEAKKNNLFSFRKSLIDYGFKENLVDDWLLVRKTKKASNTKTAYDNFIKEIESRDCNFNDCLEIAVNNSWSGFKHNWIDNLKADKNGATQPKSVTEIVAGITNSQAARDFIASRKSS